MVVLHGLPLFALPHFGLLPVFPQLAVPVRIWFITWVVARVGADRARGARYLTWPLSRLPLLARVLRLERAGCQLLPPPVSAAAVDQ